MIKSVSHDDCENNLELAPADEYCQCDKCGMSGSKYYCKEHDWYICEDCFKKEGSVVLGGNCSCKVPTCGSVYLAEDNFIDSIPNYKYNEYDLEE